MREKKEMMLKSSGTRRAFCGQKARYAKIEEKFLECVSEKRQFGYTVSTEMCLSIGERTGNRWFQSKPWVDYEVLYFFFFTRNELCVRRKTSVSQQLLAAYEEKILCFQKYIISLQRQHSYQNLESSGCNCSGNTKNSAFKLRNCLLCAHFFFRKKIKLFIKFTFLRNFKFLLLKEWGARLIQGRRVFEKIRYCSKQATDC
jgi:hypothetical protein